IDDAVKEMKQGGYGYHIIWKNIDRLFTPENVKWIQQQLSNPS
ncbi:protein tyrosine phosphatase, partial [Acinetobacter baumannii]